MTETIFATLNHCDVENLSGFSEHRRMTRELILKRVSNNRFEDADNVRSDYRAHSEKVLAAIPKRATTRLQTGRRFGTAMPFLRCQRTRN